MIDLSNENIIYKENEKVKYIQFRKLLEYSDILEHFFLIKNKEYNYKENIDERYNNILKSLNVKYSNVAKISQTHTNNVEIISANNVNNVFKDTDGILTNQKEIVLPIQVADCISMILFDPNKKVIANIHSGWKGTVQRIVQVAVKKMIESYSCNAYDIICCMSPSIRKCHFEVHDDVKEIFEKEYKNMKEIIYDEGNGKYLIDTIQINKLLLLELGLKEENIIDSKICTVCNSDCMHSYRTEKEKSGRNLSIVTLI